MNIVSSSQTAAFTSSSSKIATTGSQDILSSKTIGCGTKRGKLYYLDLASDGEASLSQAYKIGGMNVDKQTSETENDRSPSKNSTLCKSDQSQVESDRSPPENSTLCKNDRSPEDRDRSSPCCQTQEEIIIEEFLPTQENSSAPVPHQSPAEDVIQVTFSPETDNINEISRDDLISEGTEPAYQLPK
ncbi:hypothetical protein L3X38_024205 [Prunus dulcis]|uniref:Uncharacterized protein n=1 Tax=Prunus dulcis TaxID=3755 RepID=A0AAD4Z579_PRUDU|nr:hypothetical protein L3X38_024205 [Prunus dulcis]